jgi:hypothetical protein
MKQDDETRQTNWTWNQTHEAGLDELDLMSRIWTP